jgi:hypothetical protein
VADNTEPSEGLTSDGNFDMLDYIDRAIAAAAETPDDTSLGDTADGPVSDDETGELPADNGADAEETETEAPDEGAEDVAPTEAPVEEKPAEQAPPPPDPREAEIAALKDLVAQSQQAIRDLVAARQQPATAPTHSSKVSEEAVRLALFGGQEGAEQWKALNPQERAEAERVAREYFKREAKVAVNPAARFEEIRELVLSEVAQAFGPLVQDFYDRQAAETFKSVAGDIKDPADRKRLQELYAQSPGSTGNSLREQKAALELAKQRLDIERQKKQLEAKEQKLLAKDRQETANRNTRLGGKSAPVRRPDGASNKRPEWKDGENMLDFFNKAMAMESAGA